MWVCNWIATALSVSLKVNFSQNPSFTSQPRNPSSASEGAQLILQWNYNLQGQGIGSAVISNVTDGISVAPPVAGKTPGSNAAVTTGYEQVFSVAISDTQATLTFLALQRSDSGNKYRLQITTGGFFSMTSDVLDISVLIPAKITKSSVSPEKVRENSTVHLICEASGEPTPNITWAKVLGKGSMGDILTAQNSKFIRNITNINRSEAGTYRCTANNGIGQSDHKELEVEVLYPAKVVSLPREYNVAVQQSETLDCQAEGMPNPSVTWTPCDPSENVCNQSQLNIHEVLDDGVYTCTVKNDLGTDSAKTSVFIAAKDINVTLEITSESCKNGKYNQSAMLSKRLNETISKIFNDSTYRNTAVRSVRCGSLFVDLTLTFSVIVKEQMVLSILKEAAKDGMLGGFSVDASSIVGTRPIKPTTSPPVDTTTKSARTAGISTLVIVLIVVGIILLLVIIVVVVVVCCIRMKKKKESKEVNDDKGGKDAGSRCGPPPGAPGQNNTGYEEPGYANTSSAARTKKDEKDGKKSSKKKDAQREEMPMYAEVDKSKKKPKPNSYSEVERPDRREPEIQYAVMDHSHPGGSMPRGAATQPRRAPETVYADLV